MALFNYDRSVWASDANSGQTMASKDIVCVHTIVGYAPALAAHFSLRGSGYIYQHRDTNRRSAANYNGNGNVIAIENADYGDGYPAWNRNDGHAVPGFLPAHRESLARLLVELHRAHGIPLELVPDSKPGRRGIAYHRQGIDGNWAGYAYGGRVAGGVLWTTSPGKVCPGDRRISELINIIIPRARVLAGLDQEAADMEADEREALFQMKGRIESIHYNGFKDIEGGPYLGGDLSFFQQQLDLYLKPALTAIHAKIDAVVAKVDAGFAGLSDDEAKIIAVIRAQPVGGAPTDAQVQQLTATLLATLPGGIAHKLGESLLAGGEE